MPSPQVTVEDIQHLAPFEELKPEVVRKNLDFVGRYTVPKGTVICREGEFGDFAFFLESGEVDVSIEHRATTVRKAQSGGGPPKTGIRLLDWIRSFRMGPNEDRYSKHNVKEGQWIRTGDLPVDLPRENPRITIGAGEIFGEMSAISRYPRSATVTAATECTVVEIGVQFLRVIMKRSKKFKGELDDKYKARALHNHLMSVPLFHGVPVEFLKALADRAALQSYKPKEEICKQGDSGDAFYLVRKGFVRVNKTVGWGTITVSYLSKGEYFGEIALLHDTERTASVIAVDEAECVAITREDFEAVCEKHPRVREELEEIAQKRMEGDKRMEWDSERAALMGFAVDTGVIHGENLLLLDLESCTRCDDCVKACADIHEGDTRLIRKGERFDRFLVASSCRQCTDPLCMVGCPTGAIYPDGELGEIRIDDRCIGCGHCARQCPYTNIIMTQIDSDKDGEPVWRATKCDLCEGRPAPACVTACPHGSALRMSAEEFVKGVRTRSL